MDKAKLHKIYNLIKDSEYNGIKGIIHLDSKIPGPSVGITICTHGNEPCGLSVVEKFTSQDFNLKQGEVFIVLNNLKATEKYFNSYTEEDESSCRFIDLNMNRLTENLENEHNYYEVERAIELKNIWSKFDYAIDLHSTPQKSNPFIIEGYKSIKQFSKYLPAEVILKNMLNVQIGKPAIAFYGHADSLIFGLETGSHNDNSALEISVDSALSLLSYLNMVDYSLKETKHSVFEIIDSILVPDNTYNLVDTIPMFTPIMAKDVIATNGINNITSPIDGIAILAPKGTAIRNHKEEVLFICKEI